MVFSKCAKSLPMGLHIQQDNCSREGKNQFVLRFCIILILLGTFRWCCLGFLRTGHTHENIDQLFAQVCTVLARKSGCCETWSAFCFRGVIWGRKVVLRCELVAARLKSRGHSTFDLQHAGRSGCYFAEVVSFRLRPLDFML